MESGLKVGEYLSLQATCLKEGEQWTNQRDSLAFVFPSEGAGKYVSAFDRLPLCPGDLLVLPPAAPGRLQPADQRGFAFSWYCLAVQHLFPLFANRELRLLKKTLEGLMPERLYSAASPLALKCQKLLNGLSPKFTLRHRGELVRIAAAVLAREFEPLPRPVTSPVDDYNAEPDCDRAKTRRWL